MIKRVGVLGGTFDPVHKGHVAIARSFIDSGLIDVLWIIPAASPPHKKGETVTSFADRKAMLDLVFGHWDNVKIDTIEEQLPRPSYTLHTIRTLKKEYPDYRFYLCLGSDSLAQFDRWYRFREILNECSLLVAARPGFDDKFISPEIMSKTQFIRHEPVQISSSNLKEKITQGSTLEEELSEAVIQYIREKGLYR